MSDTIMDLLKSETRSLHTETEGNNFQKSLFSGALPKEQFVEYERRSSTVQEKIEPFDSTTDEAGQQHSPSRPGQNHLCSIRI